MTLEAVETIRESLNSGLAIPYLGAGVLTLAGEGCPLPAAPEVLVDRLTAKASVPHKIRKQLTAAAQFIENFKHRKTVKAAMTEAFRPEREADGAASLSRFHSCPAARSCMPGMTIFRSVLSPRARGGASCRVSVRQSILARGCIISMARR